MKRRQNFINLISQKSLILFFIFLKRNRSLKISKIFYKNNTRIFKNFKYVYTKNTNTLFNYFKLFLFSINYYNFTGLYKQSNLKLKYSDKIVYNNLFYKSYSNDNNFNFINFILFNNIISKYSLLVLLNLK